MTDASSDPTALDASTLAVLANTPAALRALVGGQTDEVLARADDGGWTPRHVVAHLLAGERPAFVERIRGMLRGEAIANLDEQEMLDVSGYLNRDLGGLLRDFERQRRESVDWLRRLGDVELRTAAAHELAGEVTVADIVHHSAHHDLVHLRQVEEMLMPALDERRGAMRMF